MQELDSKPDECISFYVAARCESLVVPIIRDGTVQVRPSRLVSGFTPYDIFPDTQKGILEIGCLFCAARKRVEIWCYQNFYVTI